MVAGYPVINPIGKICEHAHASGSWVHVDGAFGLWARVLPSMRKTCDGIEMADSWSLDAHQTLNVPYDSGIIACRHREAPSLHAIRESRIASSPRDKMFISHIAFVSLLVPSAAVGGYHANT